MGRRLNLQAELEEILGSKNVYYQPPSTVSLKYPCIIYSLTRTNTIRADNRIYKATNEYHVKHIFKSLESEKKDDLLNHFLMISHDARFVADKMYNDEFTLYY